MVFVIHLFQSRTVQPVQSQIPQCTHSFYRILLIVFVVTILAGN